MVVIDMKTERDDDVLSVWLGGRLEGTNSEEFQAAIESAMAASDRALIMDLKDLSYISSAGLRAILFTAKKLWDQEAHFGLCSVPETVLEVLRMSGFDNFLSIHDDREGALAEVRS